MSENKRSNEIGAIWVKSNNSGEYLSISVELDGKKHNFTAFKSKYKAEGDNKPTYYIPAPRIESNELKQGGTSATLSKYEQQLNQILAQKEANERLKAVTNDKSASFNQEASFTEEDLPF